MTGNQTLQLSEIPSLKLDALIDLIHGASAIGHALARIDEHQRSSVLATLSQTLESFELPVDVTPRFIVKVAMETCNDAQYPVWLASVVSGRVPGSNKAKAR